MNDTFRGNTPHLISCIEALLHLDADGALVPHGIGGHARDLLESAATRLAPRAEEIDMCRQHGEALQRIGSALGLAAGSDVHRESIPAIEALKVRADMVDEPVRWGNPGTVGMFVRQLQTIDPATPLHAAIHTEYRGKKVATTNHVTISRERVSGRFIRQGDETVPYSIVVWAQQDQLAQPPEFPPMPEGWHVTVGLFGDTRLTISENGYGGAVLSDADDDLIAGAARHLLSFIGYGLPPSAFDPEDSAPPPDCQPDGKVFIRVVADDPATCGRATANQEAHNRIYDLLLSDDGQAWKEARRYLERSAPELAALLAQPAPVQQDEIGQKAFARYIKDCDECAIVPDVAGAFHWAWTHAAPLRPGQQLVPVEATDDMEAAAENDYEDTGATFPDWKSAYRAMIAAAPSAAIAAREQEALSVDCPHCWQKAGEPCIWPETRTCNRDAPHEARKAEAKKQFLGAPASREEAPAPQQSALSRDALIDLIEEHLYAVYHCGRVWEAWQVGTMTEGDFTEARGSDLAPDLADAILAASATPAEPMDWPLPCDVTVGHGTMRKGVALRTLVLRMKTLYEMATGNDADVVAERTPEERQALATKFLAATAPAQAFDAWCCEKGEAAGQRVCTECAETSLGYSAAMGVQPDETPLETSEGDAR